MKNTWLIIVGAIILIGLSAFFIITLTKEEKYFNHVELSDNNQIVNSLKETYYDTILSVGLDQVNLNGVVVVVSELSNGAKNQFNGDLKAHIRYYNGIYYLFIDGFSREEGIEVISHEIIHILQYNTGQLYYDNEFVIWETQPYDINEIEYDGRPWEREAFNRSPSLSNKISQILYE